MTIPAAAIAHDLYKYGYLVADTYPNVQANNPSFDNRTGLQECFNDARNTNRTVWLNTKNGIYYISDFLMMHYFREWNASFPQVNFKVHGRPNGKPTIKLMSTASNFSNINSPRPVIIWGMYAAANENAVNDIAPANPLTGTLTNWTGPTAGDHFHFELANIDFDLSGFAGAVGLRTATAQNSYLHNIKVIATGAYAGFRGISGAGAIAHNIEVVGGRHAIWQPGGASHTVVGFKASGQTVSVIEEPNPFSPGVYIGFDVILNNIPLVKLSGSQYAGVVGSTIWIDGKVKNTSGNPIIFQNGIDQTARQYSMYIENVYVENSTVPIKCNNVSFTNPNTNVTWIKRFVNNTLFNVNPATYIGTKVFREYSVINGVSSFTTKTPISEMEFISGLPNIDFVNMHLDKATKWYDPDDNALWDRTLHTPNTNVTVSEWSRINSALNSGKQYVLLGKGDWYIDKPVLIPENVNLFGANSRWSCLRTIAGGTFTPNSGYIIDTVDSATSTTSVANVNFTQTLASGNTSNWNAGLIRWRVGKSGSVFAVYNRSNSSTVFQTDKRYIYYVTGNGAGPIYNANQYATRAEGSANLLTRTVMIKDKTSSDVIRFYGFNLETTKGNEAPISEYACEIDNSSHIRMYAWKREGSSASLKITNGNNIGLYGSGRVTTNQIGKGSANIHYNILGTSNNILITLCGTDIPGGGTLTQAQLNVGTTMLRENIIGLPVITTSWPDGLSIYMRGNLPLSTVVGVEDPPPDPGPSGGFIPGKVSEDDNTVQLDFNTSEYSEIEFSGVMLVSPPEAPESTLHVSANGRYFVEDF